MNLGFYGFQALDHKEKQRLCGEAILKEFTLAKGHEGKYKARAKKVRLGADMAVLLGMKTINYIKDVIWNCSISDSILS